MVVNLGTEFIGNIDISYSAFNKFKKCKRMYKHHIDRTKKSNPTDFSYFGIGSSVHTSYDNFEKEKEKDPQLKWEDWKASPEFTKPIISMIEKIPEWQAEKDKRLKEHEIITENLKTIIENIRKRHEEITFNLWFGHWKNPLPVKHIDPRLRLMGEIDLFYFISDNEIVIDDTKTSKSAFFLDKDQLFIYAIGLEEYFRVKHDREVKVVSGNFNLVRLNKVVPVEMHGKAKEFFLAKLATLFFSFDNDYWPLTITKNTCSRCPWKDLCWGQNGITKYPSKEVVKKQKDSRKKLFTNNSKDLNNFLDV